MPTMCRLVTLLTLACAVSRSVAYEEPDCPLQTVVDFAESSDFDPNLPLTFGGGIVLEMTLTAASSNIKYARVFSFSNYGEDVVQLQMKYVVLFNVVSLSTRSNGHLSVGVSHGSGSVYGISASGTDNAKMFRVRAVILRGSTADSTTGQCFLYINGTLSSYGECPLPTFVERRANFIGHDLSDNPAFEGTVANFTLKACKVTPSVSGLPSPQCLLQNDVDFAESSDFDPNLPLTFGGGIVIEMNLTTPSTYTYDARVFSFSNYGKDVVQMNVGSGGYLFFGASRGYGSVSGIKASSTYNGKTFTLRAVILPGSTADSTTGQCLLYINGTLNAYGYCPLPTFVERRANFIGRDLLDYAPAFEGTVANFTLKACNVTPSVPTPLPSPQCPLQNDVDFAESSDFDPNLPLTFGGGVVIEMTLTISSPLSWGSCVFSFSNYGEDIVEMQIKLRGYLFFGVSRGSADVTGITSRYVNLNNGVMLTVRAVILPGITADSTTGQCFLYINNVLKAYSSSCPLPTFVERRANFIGYDLNNDPTFNVTVANFTLKACNVTPSVPTPLPSPQCLLENDVDFAESSDFDPNLPLIFGGGVVIEMTLTTPSTSSYKARVFSFSNYGDEDVVEMQILSPGAIYFGVSQGYERVTGLLSHNGYRGVTFTVRAVILPGITADSTTGQCLLYINNVLEAYSSSCPLPTFVERRANFIGYDPYDHHHTFEGTVSNFALKACNVTPSVPTPLPPPQCLLRTVVDFAESSDFDPNLPLTFGGGIEIEMTLTIPPKHSYWGHVFSFSDYGNDVVKLDVAAGTIFVSFTSTLASHYTYDGATVTVRAVMLPTGQCFLYINNVLEAEFSFCSLPTFVERRANFIGSELSDPTFEGTVANFTLKACNVTPSVPTPLPSPQCLLQNDVDFAESSDFDPNLPLIFGGGIVIEMTLTTPSSYSKYARLFSFSNYGEDVVHMTVAYGGTIFFGVSRGSGNVSGIATSSVWNGVTVTLRAVILPGITADSTTGQCLLYINNVLDAYSSCPLPMKVVRKENFVGNDTDSSKPTFQGTVADFSMRSCNGSVTTTPTTVPTIVPTTPTAVPTAEPTVVPTPLPTSAPTALNNATAFDETDAPTTAAPEKEKDDSRTSWWVWVMLGLGTLLVLLVGGVLLCFCRRGNGTSPPTVDSHHIQAETDHEAAELLNYGVDDDGSELAC